MFTEGKVTLLPSISGYIIYRRSHGLMSKMGKKYFKIIPNQGVLIKFPDQSHSEHISDITIDYYNLLKKEQEKLGIEVFKLVDIRGPELTRSIRSEFDKRQQHALELLHRKKKSES